MAVAVAITKLKRSRGGYKSCLTNCFKKLDDLAADKSKDLICLNSLLNNSISYMQNIQTLDHEIISTIEDETQLEEFCKECDDYRFTANKKIEEFKFYVFSLKEVKADPKSDVIPKINNFHTKLGKLSLPILDGKNILDYPNWFDSFSNAVDKNNHITDVEKFTRLRMCLKEPALSLIDGFTISSKNYRAAFDIIKLRYGNSDEIVRSYTKAFKNIRVHNYSLESVRELSAKVQCYKRVLDSYDTAVQTYESIILPEIFDSLPQALKDSLASLASNVRNVDCKYDEFCGTLQKVIEFLSKTRPSQSIETNAALLAQGNHHQTQKPPSRNFQNIDRNTGTQNRFQRTCNFCGSDSHSKWYCTKYVNPQGRLARVRELGLCGNCLGHNHNTSTCFHQDRCKHCNQKHHTLLHLAQVNSEGSWRTNKSAQSGQKQNPPPKFNPNSQNNSQAHAHFVPADNEQNLPNQSKSNTNTVDTVESFVGFTPSTKKVENMTVLLKTANLLLKSKEISLFSNGLFDDGSTLSYCSTALCEQLNLKPVSRKAINISVFGSVNKSLRELDCVEIDVICDDNTKITITCLVVPYISMPIHTGNRNCLNNYPQFRNLKLAHPINDDEYFSVELLIGSNYYEQFFMNTKIRTSDSSPLVASLSKVGFLVSGPIPISSYTKDTSIFHIVCNADIEKADFQSFWSLEQLGLQNPDIEREISLEEYVSQIEYKDNRYICPFPWKPNAPPLPTNYAISLNRTKSTIKRLVKTNHLKTYDSILKQQLKLGFIEKVEDNLHNPNAHYLPHQPIFKDSSTTPLRIVYDCSCRSSKKSPSLNDCLYKGPPLQTDIAAILIRFRLGNYVTVADIEKAFLQILLKDCDKDFTRFFFCSDIENPEGKLDIYRFLALLFGTSPSPFILGATVLYHLSQNPCPDIRLLDKDLFVDNVISSFLDQQSAVKFYQSSRTIFKKGSFNLRCWASNSSDVNKLAAAENVREKNPELVTILGLLWDAMKDEIKFKPLVILVATELTKRYILSSCSRIYDPLGLLNPVTITAKSMIQDLFRAKLDWDTSCSEFRENWKVISYNIEQASLISFPRQYCDIDMSKPFYLHIFSDSSDRNYGTASYLTHNNQSSLIMAKSKVKPIREDSISTSVPKLELLGCVLASKLKKYLEKAFKESRINPKLETHLWSDSQSALRMIFTDKILKRFENNCVTKILDNTSISQWHYTPSELNPSDLTTRGITASELKSSKLWWHGPEYLLLPKDQWPQWETDNNIPVTVLFVNTSTAATIYPGVHNFIDISRFSKLNKLLHVTMYVLRFIRIISKSSSGLNKGPFTKEEWAGSKQIWIRSAQQTTWPQEYFYLNQDKDKRVGKPGQIISQLNLNLVDTLLCCQGRLANAPILLTAKFPILLPKNHKLTLLIAEFKHREILHKSAADTIAHIRIEYWVPCILQLVKDVIKHCIPCKTVFGRHYPKPIPAPLQSLRLRDSNPFVCSGVDFTGAIPNIIDPSNPTENMKVYILLFTCASTRCIHLEVTKDMSLDTFMLAFRRFCAYRSTPQYILSDNAQTFLAADKTIRELLSSPELTHELANRNIEWINIPVKAPWYGGFYERLVQGVKRHLRISMGKSRIRFTELQTLTTEIMCLMNDRPITATYTDLGSPSPLTPSELFQGRKINSFPYPINDIDELGDQDYITPSDFEKRVQKQSKLFQHFRERWKSEYLLSLRKYHSSKGSEVIHIKRGDLVHVHEDRPRINWNLAIVTELIYGNDGIVRSAKIRTANGCTNRPIVKLFPLEVNADSFVDDLNQVSNFEGSQDDGSPATLRPIRAAAVAARQKIANLAKTPH